jgi:hypothetical protein
MLSSTPLTPEQAARLPLYAQQHIGWLAMRVAGLTREVAELRAGPEKSNVYIKKFEGPDRLLGIGTGIRFRLAGARPDAEIEVRHGATPGVLEVTCPSGDALHVTPQASNIIRVRIGEY